MISAILLAAGESRRMGRLKPLLPFGSKTVIETCLDALLASRVDEIVVILGYGADEIRQQIASLPVKCVFNQHYQQGMSSSVKAGVRCVQSDARAVVIALVDQPLITSDVVDRIIDAYVTEGKTIVVPEYGGRRGHPVLIDLAYRDEILNVDPQVGLRQVVRHHGPETLRLPVETDAVIQNLNTWDDYQRMLRSSSYRNR